MSERNDIDTRADDLEGRLFTLARADRPSAAAHRRALLALGVGASVATAAAVSEGAAMVKAGALAGASVATGHVAKTVAVVSIFKWAAMGAVAGTVALGGAVGIERLTSHTVSHAVAISEPIPSAREDEAKGRASRSPIPGRSVEPELMPTEPAIRANGDRDSFRQVPATRTSASAASDPVPAAPEAPSREVDTASSLEEEVTRINRARLALSSGAPARALGELDDYDARFPAGMMKPEATVVRIEAMVQNGNLVGAKVLGRKFLSAHPSGGLSVRVHKVIGE